VNGNLQNAETTLSVKDNVGLERLNNMHVQEASMLTPEDETDLHSNSVDDDEQSFPDIKSVPSAVCQINGEFMCSCCGVMMKCARAIKRHLSTHVSAQSFRPPTTQSCKTADNADDVSKDDVTQSEPKEQLNVYKRLPSPGISADSSERKPDSNDNIGIKWRSYPCKDCDRKFTASVLLQRHRVQMHKPNKCQKCGMVLAGKWNFSQHVRSEHPGLQISEVC